MKPPLLADIETLARQAGAILRQGFDEAHTIEYKGIIDPVTEMDHASENFLLAEINKRWPGGTITSEERGLTEGEPEQSWYVDPLDGTVNYAHRIPIFSVSIACALDQSVRLGGVYDPMRDEMFSAERGQGRAAQRGSDPRFQGDRAAEESARDGLPVRRLGLGTGQLRQLRAPGETHAGGAATGVGGARRLLGRGRPVRRLLGNRH